MVKADVAKGELSIADAAARLRKKYQWTRNRVIEGRLLQGRRAPNGRGWLVDAESVERLARWLEAEPHHG